MKVEVYDNINSLLWIKVYKRISITDNEGGKK